MEPEDYDLVGFCVGVVEKDEIIDGSRVEPEDRLIGISSSGVHSNGFSLVRKLLFDSGDFNLDDQVKSLAYPLGEELLIPTTVYTPGVLEVARECDLKAAAHITGGGITENLPRVIPDDVNAEVYLGTWPVKNIFTFVQSAGDIDLFEMLRVFNMGVGMILVVPPTDVRKALQVLDLGRYKAYEVGEIVEGTGQVRYR
jgi:phosphoribosylformylglycinamidine cyclo-ligase